jgi:hypothetical protein
MTLKCRCSFPWNSNVRPDRKRTLESSGMEIIFNPLSATSGRCSDLLGDISDPVIRSFPAPH